MKRLASSAAALGLLAPVTALVWSGCAGVLGVDDYQGAVDALCCSEVVDKIPTCAQDVTARLDAGESAAVKDWIGRFDDSCACNIGCYYRDPICLRSDETCSSSAQCCGADTGEGHCCLRVTDGTKACCSSCRSCEEVLDAKGGGLEPICEEALRAIDDLFVCVCDVCATECGDSSYCSASNKASAACNVCVSAAVLPNGACRAVADACTQE